MQIAETQIFEIGIPADAADELIAFVYHRTMKGKYVPFVLQNLANALAPAEDAYEEVHKRNNEAKEGVHYGLPEDTKVPD